MSTAVTITGPTNYSGNGQIIDVAAGSVSIGGGTDTVLSAAAGVGIRLGASNSLISVTGANSTITAGVPSLGASDDDSLILAGNYNIVNDYGFNGGGVTLNGSHDKLVSNQRIETANVVINGSNDSFYSLYLTGNVVINGNNDIIVAGAGNFTVTGNNDTITSVQAKTVVDSGANNTILNEAVTGQTIPYNLAAGSAGADTTPGTQFSITGAGAKVTSLNDNDSVVSSGGQSTISLQSYNNTVAASGAAADISTETTSEIISISGGNSTVSTSAPLFSPPSATVPSASVTFTGNASVGATFNNGSPDLASTVASSIPVTLNLGASNSSVYAAANTTVNDTTGANRFTVTGASKVDITAGNDTVNVLDGSALTNDTISGTALRPNIVNFGADDFYVGRVNNSMSQDNILNFTGDNDSGVIFAGDHDTLNASGSNGLFLLQTNSSNFGSNLPNTVATDSIGSAINVTGNNTVMALCGFNTINASNGATLIVNADDNSITGSNMSLQMQGSANFVNVTGADTISDASPLSYAQSFVPGQLTTQNFFTVQGGQVALGGLDRLVQTQGAAQIDLFGGNAVTLNGANDTVNAADQVYGGNVITNNGVNNQLYVADVSNSATTIIASANTYVKLTDDTGKMIGGPNNNSGETLDFIGGSGTSNTILGAGSNAAVTLYGGASTRDVASGGAGGANSLNGGAGSYDLFQAGGANDVLIAGSGGNNTLVSAAGNETLVSSLAGTDMISITGGGGTDVIQNFNGSLQIAAQLNVASQVVSGGALNVTLNDGTRIIFSGLTSLAQNGNVFSH